MQILELYKQYIDPDFTWSNFTLEEQAKVIVAPRSNNLLDTQRVRVEALVAVVQAAVACWRQLVRQLCYWLLHASWIGCKVVV